MEAGRIYQTIARKILDNTFDASAGQKLLEQFIRKYPASLYGEAAKACLEKKAQDKENKESLDPATYFHAKGNGDELDKHSYYQD